MFYRKVLSDFEIKIQRNLKLRITWVKCVFIYEQFFLLNFNNTFACKQCLEIRAIQEVSIRCFLINYYKYLKFFLCWNLLWYTSILGHDQISGTNYTRNSRFDSRFSGKIQVRILSYSKLIKVLKIILFSENFPINLIMYKNILRIFLTI